MLAMILLRNRAVTAQTVFAVQNYNGIMVFFTLHVVYTIIGYAAGSIRTKKPLQWRAAASKIKQLEFSIERETRSTKLYLAYSVARVSRITVTRIWPGYCRLSSIFLAISLLMVMAVKSSTSSGRTNTRTSRPA